jgi:hypothetical protein
MGIGQSGALAARRRCARSPLFLWYRKDKTLQDMSDDERQSLITELDVVYGDGDPWYGFERLSPPTTEKSARAESVSLTMRRGVKRAFIRGEGPFLMSFFSPSSRPTVTFLARRTLQDHADRRPPFLRRRWALSRPDFSHATAVRTHTPSRLSNVRSMRNDLTWLSSPATS